MKRMTTGRESAIREALNYLEAFGIPASHVRGVTVHAEVQDVPRITAEMFMHHTEDGQPDTGEISEQLRQRLVLQGWTPPREYGKEALAEASSEASPTELGAPRDLVFGFFAADPGHHLPPCQWPDEPCTGHSTPLVRPYADPGVTQRLSIQDETLVFPRVDHQEGK